MSFCEKSPANVERATGAEEKTFRSQLHFATHCTSGNLRHLYVFPLTVSFTKHQRVTEISISICIFGRDELGEKRLSRSLDPHPSRSQQPLPRHYPLQDKRW